MTEEDKNRVEFILMRYEAVYRDRIRDEELQKELDRRLASV